MPFEHVEAGLRSFNVRSVEEVNRRALREALLAELAAGSDRGAIIDRALAAVGVRDDTAAQLIPELVEAFTSHTPQRLPAYRGARQALAELAGRYRVVCLTDGNPRIQRAKLAALELSSAFYDVVITDTLGGRHLRKPNPAGLLRGAQLLMVPACDLVVVGDRPGKDVAVAATCDAAAIRVRSGEYAHTPDSPAASAVVDTFTDAVALLLALP